jgi:hypothetical protein
MKRFSARSSASHSISAGARSSVKRRGSQTSGEAEIDATIGVAEFLADYQRFKPWLDRMERLLKRERLSEWSMQERARLLSIQANLDELSAKASAHSEASASPPVEESKTGLAVGEAR